ncbi:ATP-binding cassette domain-containing protein [Actinobacillus pleuropneumoniae]|uniref:Peptide transport system ATP-binding protein n=2 Tax=Actinobacillus pleuropneumoniae TaxID=715 RepID=B0BQI1_ACTPJ|nr:ABC transporter ATP-binding protein [Actinobacillus pleuropneumoniae]ABY69816.1 peptide transport system ATP-binding protein [Actinobacillus pleuropneumoniae serovar 3 str. JL03]EFL80818.1 peptide transport system ATP-binding protein [Actinobacillus pleuropneumoniae serovar 6 str. Femo]EFM91693.1 Peptide transport system ATP-binding protein SapF [Actinobacillus pleuropneumoniae serovar 6 str. Femo]KIE90228.1 putative peptide transport system ATP-binding protein [Actinobacillus pleuropneumoni
MPLLDIKRLNKHFTDRIGLFRKHDFYAVKDVSFTLERGETIAIIGENGAGKSILSKMIAGITKPTSGEMVFKGQALHFGDYRFRAKHIRMMFQDPNDAFDPNYNVGQILDSPLRLATNLNESERNDRIFSTLRLVGMYPEHALIPIRETSSSQKQRIALARALILSPEIIIADDTLSTLDFSVKTQLTNLMLNLQERLGISFIYVGQHLGIIKHIADKLMVMHEGEVIEYGLTKDVLLDPQSLITARLIESHFGKKLTPEAWGDSY